MTLKEYYKSLKKFISKNPKCLDMEVYYSSDDEGNSFHEVIYEPSKKKLDVDGYGNEINKKVVIIN